MTKKSKRQLEFEGHSHKQAIQKLRKQINDAKGKSYFSSTDAARDVIKSNTLQLASALNEWVDKVSSGRAVTRGDAALVPELKEWMKFVSAEFIAVIILKSVLDIHGHGFDDPTSAKVAKFIGGRLEDELRFAFYEITAPQEVVDAAWKRVTEAGSTPFYRRLSTKLITEKLLNELEPEAEKWSSWDAGYKCSMGLLLLEFTTKFGIIQKENVRVGKKTKGYVKLTPEYIDYFERYYEAMEDIAYFRKPLIEKPLEWQYLPGPSIHNTTGGYHTDKLRNQLPMCRGYAHQTEFSEQSVRYLNTLGRTAYCVDHEILLVAQHLKDKSICVGTFLPYQRSQSLDEPMPPDLVALPTDHPERIAWRMEKREQHERHNEMVKKSIRSVRSLQAAQEFLKEPRFYLSWSFDYRGRAYPCQPWLQPQSTEFEKSLIRFADGCKVDQRAEFWIAQALASCYNGTSKSLKERVEWTHSNWELISQVASEPLNSITLWEQAKEPFQFLQMAIEYYKVIITQTQHLWYLPIGVDATCSGLQLLSGCLRDEKGMKHSNVLPPSSPDADPEDAYMLVLDEARRLAEKKHPELTQYLIHRNLGKTTMVMLYGATTLTVKNRVRDAFVNLGIYGNDKEIDYKKAYQIAKLVQQASANVFPKAFKALGWLKELATQASNLQLDAFSWVTPSGDTISYRYFKTDTISLRLPHLGKVKIPVDSSRELDYKGMISALCPSYIHSLDASLLKIAFDEWNRPLTSIHDCFKCLPTEMDRAQEAIRRAFYTVCDGNPLDRLAEGLQVHTEALERLPQGKGDLRQVLNSTYLFN